MQWIDPSSIEHNVLVIHPSIRLATCNRHGPKIGGYAPFGGSWVHILHNVAWARIKGYLSTEWHLDPSSHLATTFRSSHRPPHQLELWGAL